MTFHIIINESNKEIPFQQHNYSDFRNDFINVRQAFSENLVYDFSYSGNIVNFQVSFSGTYKIEAWGARGGSGSSTTGPLGAYSKSFVLLNKDERIKILVGEKGYPGHSGCGGNYVHEGGGGGGTFIAKDRTPLCVAGGGGGSFTLKAFSTVQSHACGQSTQRSANIGNGQATLRMGGIGTTHGGGGGGFEGNGGDGSGYGKGGYSFLNGGARQTSGGYEGSANGGFGGGGSQSGCCSGGCGSGGGGGYTGGSSYPSDSKQGGGGGSYFEGSYNNESSLAISGCDANLPTNPGTNGNGFARLTLFLSIPTSSNKCATCSHNKTPILWTFFAILLSQ